MKEPWEIIDIFKVLVWNDKHMTLIVGIFSGCHKSRYVGRLKNDVHLFELAFDAFSALNQ